MATLNLNEVDYTRLNHSWGSKGQRRTITVEYQPSDALLQYLRDMKDALKMALAYTYFMAKESGGRAPNPIVLRKKIKRWFYSRYDYARHHINPVCRTAVALISSYSKKHKRLGIPELKRLVMRIDDELFKLENNEDEVSVRITLQPFKYEYIRFTPSHKKWDAYSKGRASELLVTDRKLCITFAVNGSEEKPVGSRFIASDLNSRTIDSTLASQYDGGIKLDGVETESISGIAQIQNDFSRRRRRLQLHIRNPQKRAKKLTQTGGRQRNRIIDALQKLSTKQIKENPQASFIFEKLAGIRENSFSNGSNKLRAYLNRWPYRMYQSMIDYKAPYRTLYVKPGGTSSKCPVCGGKLEHPAWAVSRCRKCGVDYDRERLASLAILCRRLRLWGYPFTPSADASWQQLRDEYLYAPVMPDSEGAGWTEHAANAPNGNVVYENTHS